MDLQSYIRKYPRNERAGIRHKLAKAHGVSEVTVRAWANNTRKHPYTLKAVEITEKLTDNQVTRFDLRPEIFGDPPKRKRSSKKAPSKKRARTAKSTTGNANATASTRRKKAASKKSSKSKA